MNSLNKDLKFKVVIFKEEVLDDEIVPDQHPFLVTSGFGASSYAGGNGLHGIFLSDGEEANMEGIGVERFATEDEIVAAKQHGEILDSKHVDVSRVLGDNDD